MRVLLDSMNATYEELKEIVNLRNDVVRFVRSDIPAVKGDPCLVFTHALLLSFVEETKPDPTLFEVAINYGVGPPVNTDKAKEPGQPQVVREEELVMFEAFMKKQGLSLRPGRIELI